MAVLNLVYAPDPVFKKKAALVAQVDDAVRQLADDMLDTMYFEKAVGMGANMVGVLQQVAVLDLMVDGVKNPYVLINPVVTPVGTETQTIEEASLCFPYISALITRPKFIKVDYLDRNGAAQTLDASGDLAQVIQHEVDYLHGKVFLDYLSPLKRNMLIKKMVKQMKAHPPHVHGAGCNH